MPTTWSQPIKKRKLEAEDVIQLVEGKIIDFIFCDELLDSYTFSSRERRTFIRNRSEWWSTSWGLMLKDPLIRDPSSTEGKSFRRRFRIPATFFLDWLVPRCRAANIFGSKITRKGSLMGHIPIEIKILIALRILGRGNVCDDISEMSKVGHSTVFRIFHQFVLFTSSSSSFSK
jgi:hypothetical protein